MDKQTCLNSLICCDAKISRAHRRVCHGRLSQSRINCLQQEFLRRNDLVGNVFLLLRHTGMRIGECARLVL